MVRLYAHALRTALRAAGLQASRQGLQLCLVALAATPALAAPPDPAAAAAPLAMTLPEALAYARAHQPTLAAARARVEVARRAASAIRAEWLPQVGGAAQLFVGSANNSTGLALPSRVLDLPRVGGTRTDPGVGFGGVFPSTLVAVGVRQQAFDFGRIAAQAAAADLDVEVSRERARGAALDLTLQVELAYYAVLSAHAVETAAAEAVRRARLRQEMVDAAVRAGMRAPIDQSRAAADLARAGVGQARAQAAIAVAQTVLAAVVGVPQPMLAARETPAEPPAPPALAGALPEAAARDPALRAVAAQVAAQRALTRAATRQLLPGLQLTATLSARAGGAPTSTAPSGSSGWLPEIPNWDAGVLLNVPLFDAVSLARRAHSQALEVALQRELQAAQRLQRAAVQRAYTEYELARASLPGLQSAVAAAQRTHEQALARFRSGLGTSVELADAEALRTDAEIQLAVGAFEISRARVLLGRTLAEERAVSDSPIKETQR